MTFSKLTNTTFADMAKQMKASDNFVICGHISPDGDCIGSQLALMYTLRALGKHALCVFASSDVASSQVSFLPSFDEIVPANQLSLDDISFVAVDVSDIGRLGDAAQLLHASKISFTLDHHQPLVSLCKYEIIDPDSPSASVLIWELIKELTSSPSLNSALACYTGLVTDTGNFAFQNTNVRAFEAAAELISYGVKPEQLNAQIFENRSLASLKLEATVINHMQISSDGQVCLSWISSQDMESAQAVKHDTDPLIDTLRSLQGVRVCCILREQGEVVRGSLRAKDESDVSKLALEFGGGGHRAAAGFTLDIPLEDAVTLLLDKLEKLLED